jgi:H/ACA ribonucleoprotein complex subunit 4
MANSTYVASLPYPRKFTNIQQKYGRPNEATPAKWNAEYKDFGAPAGEQAVIQGENGMEVDDEEKAASEAEEEEEIAVAAEDGEKKKKRKHEGETAEEKAERKKKKKAEKAAKS